MAKTYARGNEITPSGKRLVNNNKTPQTKRMKVIQKTFNKGSDEEDYGDDNKHHDDCKRDSHWRKTIYDMNKSELGETLEKQKRHIKEQEMKLANKKETGRQSQK